MTDLYESTERHSYTRWRGIEELQVQESNVDNGVVVVKTREDGECKRQTDLSSEINKAPFHSK